LAEELIMVGRRNRALNCNVQFTKELMKGYTANSDNITHYPKSKCHKEVMRSRQMRIVTCARQHFAKTI
jgi:hypothetical protein